jgi:hypothetical protein
MRCFPEWFHVVMEDRGNYVRRSVIGIVSLLVPQNRQQRSSVLPNF